ncbi:hypothetical protein KEJ17_07490, partial [Candidatus Bathyarchaeota archaeon]|nr:hypothetical protein [Candidatus Bathyarchaeota archaeon]
EIIGSGGGKTHSTTVILTIQEKSTPKPKLPDLVFRKAVLDRDEPFRVGDVIRFGADLANHGDGDAYGFRVDVYLDGQLYDSGMVSLGAHASETLWSDKPWTATEGTHTVKWVADTTNIVAESNEGNNEIDKAFTVESKPRGSFDPDRGSFFAVASGKSVQSGLSYANSLGEDVVVMFTISIASSGSVVDAPTGRAYNGQTGTVTVTSKPLDPGTYHVGWTAFRASDISFSDPISWSTSNEIKTVIIERPSERYRLTSAFVWVDYSDGKRYKAILVEKEGDQEPPKQILSNLEDLEAFFEWRYSHQNFLVLDTEGNIVSDPTKYIDIARSAYALLSIQPPSELENKAKFYRDIAKESEYMDLLQLVGKIAGYALGVIIINYATGSASAVNEIVKGGMKTTVNSLADKLFTATSKAGVGSIFTCGMRYFLEDAAMNAEEAARIIRPIYKEAIKRNDITGMVIKSTDIDKYLRCVEKADIYGFSGIRGLVIAYRKGVIGYLENVAIQVVSGTDPTQASLAFYISEAMETDLKLREFIQETSAREIEYCIKKEAFQKETKKIQSIFLQQGNQSLFLSAESVEPKLKHHILIGSHSNDGLENIGKVIFNGIELTLPSSIMADKEEVFSITAKPYEGYEFIEWESAGTIELTNKKAQTTSLTVGGDGWLEAIFRPSGTETSDVSSAINLTADTYLIVLGDQVLLRARIDPPHSASVRIEFSPDKVDWYLLAEGVSSEDGIFEYAWVPDSSATYFIRATWGGDSDHLGATSEIITIVVHGAVEYILIINTNPRAGNIHFKVDYKDYYTNNEGSFSIRLNSGSHIIQLVDTTIILGSTKYIFSSWGGAMTSSSNPLMFDISEDVTLTANFTPSKHGTIVKSLKEIRQKIDEFIRSTLKWLEELLSRLIHR